MGSVYNTSLQLPIITSSSGDQGSFDFHAPVTSNSIVSTEFGFQYDSTETLAERVIHQASTLAVRNTLRGNTEQGGKRSVIELT